MFGLWKTPVVTFFCTGLCVHPVHIVSTVLQHLITIFLGSLDTVTQAPLIEMGKMMSLHITAKRYQPTQKGMLLLQVAG